MTVDQNLELLAGRRLEFVCYELELVCHIACVIVTPPVKGSVHNDDLQGVNCFCIVASFLECRHLLLVQEISKSLSNIR